MELLEQIKADILSVKTEGKADINECYSVKKNGNSIECRVETIENGFIITVNKDCSIPMKSGFKDYEYENKKYFSATNPFEKMDKKEEAEKSIMTAMQEFLSMKETAKQISKKAELKAKK